MEVVVYCINSFTYNNQGGNPAGVVLNADNLSNLQMQNIAKHVGYSETAFVKSDPHCDFNVQFFTPNHEVDFCGHATLATFSLLHAKEIISIQQYSQQTKAGKLNVTVENDGTITMEQTLPKYLGVIASNEIADVLNIERELFKSTCLPCEIISTGLADIIVPVPVGCLDSIKPNLDAISALSEKYNAVGLHVFEVPHLPNDITATCRNFAPLFGIPEESATGSACGALACYFAKHNITPEHHYKFEQGRCMNSPSMIIAKVREQAINNGTEITQVEVSGKAQCFDIKTITL